MKIHKLTKNIFLPISYILIILSILSIYGLYYFQKKHMLNLAEKDFKSTSKNFNRKFNDDIQMYQTFIKLISKDMKAYEFFKTKNRKALFDYYKPMYEKFKKDYNITHFYFHEINKTNFLRVHNYKKHSDLLNRITLQKSIESKSIGSGIEFGISHNFTLRVVYPWFVDNEIVAYIELGKEIDYFTPELSKLEDVDVTFTIDKKLISQENYKKWLTKSITNINFNELDNYYIIDSSLKNISKKIKKILDNKKDLENKKIYSLNKVYHVTSKSFNDVTGNEIGKMYIFTNFTKEYEFLNKWTMIIAVVVSVFLMLLGVFYFKLLRNIEKKIEKKYSHVMNLSITDSLTSLYNKRYFENSLPLQVDSAKKNNNYISFIMIDIDNFKNYNDNYGHQKGDIVIKNIAKQIKLIFKRNNDISYRIGGEEFAVVLETDVKYNTYTLAQKLRQNIQKLKIKHKYNMEFDVVTVSMGLYTVEASLINDIDELFIKADKALYESKESGRNCLREYIEMENKC